jgi:hypothetical protein
MSVVYGGDKITFSDGSTVGSGWTGMKNRIINGAMMIDQRNAGASVTVTGFGYTLDRYFANASQSSKYTVQRNAGSVTPPVGFTNYYGATSSSAYSISSSDYFLIAQLIEGYNCADLAWGTANAQTVTLSFWVRSSLTGTFGGSIQNAAADRSYTFSYTISAANTWEQKSVTIAGDTSGTWLTSNLTGMFVGFGLGVGSTYSTTAGSWTAGNYASATGATSVVGTNGATFYITGVQLEKGSTATSFDYRPYGTELALCQRYYEKTYSTSVAVGSNDSNGYYSFTATSNPNGFVVFAIRAKVEKRAAPTITGWTPSGTSGSWDYSRSGASGSNSFLSDNLGTSGGRAYTNIGANWTAGSIEGQWAMNSEL